MQGICPDNAKCENNQGGFNCNCADGYEGDYCSDINECSSTTSCPENAKCINTDGSYTCRCNEGFYGDGDSCFPGHCQDMYCPKNQECISATTTGCECKEGFQMNNLSFCEDVNECEQNVNKCDQQAECLNIAGSYICIDAFSTTARTNITLATSAIIKELLKTQPTLASTNTTLATSTFTTEMSTTQAISTPTKRPLPTSFR